MGRTVVVSGGGTGIGRAIAEAFREVGDEVVIIGRRAEVLDETARVIGAQALVADLTDPAAVESLATQLPEQVSVLVNCAGGNTTIGEPEPASLVDLAQSWHRNLDANVLTAVLLTAALDERLVAGGAVVSFSSVAADRGAGSYGAAKAALAAWNVSLAQDLGPRDITANVIAPGFIDDTEFFHGRMTDERRATIANATQLKRVGRPDEIAGTVQFLASAAARYLTGQVIAVNGGWVTTR